MSLFSVWREQLLSRYETSWGGGGGGHCHGVLTELTFAVMVRREIFWFDMVWDSDACSGLAWYGLV